MMKTRLTELLSIEKPIIQGGLAYLAYSDLCAAVSNAGGLGQITAMSLAGPEELRQEIQKVRELTDKPFGVNYAIGQHGRPFETMLQVAIDEQVPVVTMTGGNPAPLFDMLQGTNIKKLVLVAAARQAEKAQQLGADAVIVVGQEGGGHLGRDDIGTQVLIRNVAQSLSIPIVASGGIVDGYGIMSAIALGAEGVEMGTRFIATQECVHASESYKQAIVAASVQDTVVIKRTLGSPARALRSSWTEQILEIESRTPTYEALKDMISGEANKKFIYDGSDSQGFGWAGQAVGLITDTPSVAELFHRWDNEMEEVKSRWCR